MHGETPPTDEPRPDGPDDRAGEDTVLYSPESSARTPAGDFPPDALFRAGDSVGSYRVLRFLGRGGMGEVYEAEQTETGRVVALKAMRANPRRSPMEKKRFEREGQLAAAVNHPNSVYIFGTEEAEGALLISMELVRGGNLEDRVERRGPLPIGEAVDAALQLAEGLRAAGEAGILHRDIKPSNCFIDAEGRVKIGDFGLSLSVVAPEETKLTTEGAFIGTPAFASPEQVRGGEMDVRSDIYSLGATLYYLLAGRTPFEEEKGMALLAAILEKPPEPPRATRPEIPRGLADFLLRSLAKNPDRRFQTWDDFLGALRRYAPGSARPAAPGLRFAAGIVDLLIVDVFLRMIPIPGLSFYTLLQGIHDRGAEAIPFYATYSVFLFLLYGALTEGLAGATAGKWICGLRTVGPDGGAPGLRRAAARAAVFAVHATVPLLGIVLHPLWPDRFTLVSSALDALSMTVLLLLFLPARRGNGYAALHGRLSGTRVVHRAPRREKTAFDSWEPEAGGDGAAERIGPYSVIGEIGGSEEAGILLGFDEQLDRRVWIVRVPPGTAPAEAARRDVARRGRLRWLTGRRGEEENWDAYQAPEGRALADLLRRPRDWKETRRWLLDLAREIEKGRADRTLPERIAPEQVWIGARGRAILLDFPAPAEHPFPAGAGEAIDPDDFRQVQSFLLRIARASLRGPEGPAGKGGPGGPLPLAGARLLARLEEGSWEGPEDLLRALLAHSLEGVSVSRGRRLGHMLLPLAVIVMIAGGAAVTGNHMARWERDHPDHALLKIYLRALEASGKEGAEEKEGGERPRGPEDRAALEVILADEFGDRLAGEEFWETNDTFLYGNGFIRGKRRALAEETILRAGDPGEEEVAAARARLDRFLRSEKERIARSNRIGRETAQAGLAGVSFCGFLIGFLALFSALIQPGGVLFRVFGIAVIDRRGRTVRRARGLLRTALAWIPPLLLVVLHIVHLALHALRSPRADTLFFVETVLVLLWAVAAVFGVLRPGRGVPDLLARTRLVPR